MTNKELAVQLYGDYLKAIGTMYSNPNFGGKVHIPDEREMAASIRKLTEELTAIDEK